LKIGYARVSTVDQHEELQMDALRKAGCEKFFTDKISGAKSDRPGLTQALDFARSGDALVVWKLDRLGRSIIDLINLLNSMQSRGIEFISLTESIDTTTANGKLFFHLMASFAEYERNLIRERTNAGLSAARARGRLGGRERKLKDGKLALALKMCENPDTAVKDVASTFGVTESTMYRYIREAKEKQEAEK